MFCEKHEEDSVCFRSLSFDFVERMIKLYSKFFQVCMWKVKAIYNDNKLVVSCIHPDGILN